MDPHPTITIDHYSSSNTAAASPSTSIHSKTEKNEGYHSSGSRSQQQQQQQHKSPSSKSSSQLVSGSSGSHNNTGTIFKQREHSSPNRMKGKQSKTFVPVRQRSVSPPSNNFLLASDPHTARRNRRKSVCAVLIAPPSPTIEDRNLKESYSDTRIHNDSGSSNMPDSSNRRTTVDYSANQHGSSKHQHRHRKDSTPKHSPNASPRGSKSNLAALSSSLMDTIHKANLCMRRKSSPVISEELSTYMNLHEISSLRGSLALADALSSTSNNPPEKQRKSSKQSGGSPVYVETSSGMVELRRKDHKGYNDNSRRLSSPSSLEKGKYFLLFRVVIEFNLYFESFDFFC